MERNYSYGFAGIDYGTRHVGMAWRNAAGCIVTRYVWFWDLPEAIDALVASGVRNALVEGFKGAPKLRVLMGLLEARGIFCERVSPKLTRPPRRGMKAKEIGMAIAKANGVAPNTTHEADAVCALVYGEDRWKRESMKFTRTRRQRRKAKTRGPYGYGEDGMRPYEL